MRAALPSALGSWLCAAACACNPGAERARPSPDISAEFGVFYGGQVQERQQIALELDQTVQRMGFRLELTPPPTQALDVRWELGMPGAGRIEKDSQGRLARPRRAQLGSARWRPGEARFEQILPFAAGDPLGLWNMRVTVGDRVLIDRPFLVYDQRQRDRRQRTLDVDAGL